MQVWEEYVTTWGVDEQEKVLPFLQKRCAEMSPKELRIFRGAMELNTPDDLYEVAAITYSLHNFDFYYPAKNNEELGCQLAIHNYGARGDVLPYLDFSAIGAAYAEEKGGVFVDGAFIVQCSPAELDGIKMKAESICQYGLPEDEGWSAKVHIEGPNGTDAWLRLPDYEETNGHQADELRPALDDLGAESLDDCALLEARCCFPQIDLAAEYDDLDKLVFDASNLGFALEEFGREPYFEQKLNAALMCENCDSLNFAIDIIANLNCYDFVSDADAKAAIQSILPEKHKKQPIILGALNEDAYAAGHYHTQGMWEVEGGFFKRNEKPFHYDYSEEPSQRAAATERMGLEKRLREEIDRCMAEFKEEISGWSPESLIDEAHIIAATDAAYRGFYSDADFSTETMKDLLRYENPLTVLRDAWADCADPGLVKNAEEYLKIIQKDPLFSKTYNLLQEASDQADVPLPIPDVQMGGQTM